MSFSKFMWHKFAAAESDLQWTAGDVAEIMVDDKKFCVGRFQGQWFGFAPACPHAGAALVDGYVNKSCHLVCPVHGLKFDLRNGRDSNGEGYKLKTYPVELRPDGLYIGVEERGFLKKWF
ncbi:MAG TPA: Rieske 2Fe-2S domain-containing protein [Puia sp.]|nr:Rieske 2Fe-2S domain-containing protein [Puia sp.]